MQTSGQARKSPHSPLNEFEGIANREAGLPEWSHKNEKDWPPIHSGEQSLQVIILNETGQIVLFNFIAKSLASFELDNF
jgi:hypothetical protein